MGGTKSRPRREDERARQRQQLAQQQQLAAQQQQQQQYAQSRQRQQQPGGWQYGRYPAQHMMVMRQGYPGGSRQVMVHQYPGRYMQYPGMQQQHQHQHQHQQAPMVQAPEVQVTKTVKNKAAIVKKSIKLDAGILSFDVDALCGGAVKVYKGCKETLKSGNLTLDAEEVKESTFNEGHGEVVVEGVGVGNGRGYGLIIGLWYENGEGEAAQITYLEREGEGLEVVRQTLWYENELFMLEEIYGMDETEAHNSPDVLEPFQTEDPSQDTTCVICMTDERDTTVMPCRHMCICSACADHLRQATNKCPICRTTIEGLLCLKKKTEAAESGE